MKKLLVTFTVSFLLFETSAQSYKNLVFEGAGIRGIAYAGVLKELEEREIIEDIEKVGGTSAGAITALMISIGYSSEEIYKIISGTKFKKFNDGSFMFIGGVSRLSSRYGWYRSDAFGEWLEGLLVEKTGDAAITFSELKQQGFKDLYVTATCLNRQELLVFSADNYPNMKVQDAVRISMSIPLYFEAVFIDSVGTVYEENDPELNLDVVVDGGIIGNYPIFLFDSVNYDTQNKPIRIPDKQTLGVRIDSDSQIQSDSKDQKLVPLEINNINDYMQAFYVLVLENLNRTPLIPEDWDRTISVSSVGISPKIKKLSPEQKRELVESGQVSTKHYLDGH